MMDGLKLQSRQPTKIAHKKVKKKKIVVISLSLTLMILAKSQLFWKIL